MMQWLRDWLSNHLPGTGEQPDLSIDDELYWRTMARQHGLEREWEALRCHLLTERGLIGGDNPHETEEPTDAPH